MANALTEKLFLVTGATGFLGRRMVRRLLLNGASVLLLVRDHQDRRGQQITADQRVQRMLHDLGLHGHAGRVHTLSGDLAEFDAASVSWQLQQVLAQGQFSRLVVINVAASLSMDYPGQPAARREAIIAQNLRTNVEGLHALLRMLEGLTTAAQPCLVEHLFHFSTAYAHGAAQGLLPEGPLTGRRFHNSYELSKCEGEHLVEVWARDSQHTRVTILRPSIVTGLETPDGYVAWLDSLTHTVTHTEIAPWLQRWLRLDQPRYRLIDLVSRGLQRLKFPWLPILGNRDGVIDLIDAEDVERYAWAAVMIELGRTDTATQPRVRYLHLSNPRAQTLAAVAEMTMSALDQPQAFVRRLRILPGLSAFGWAVRLLSLVPGAGRYMRLAYRRTRMLEPYLLRPEHTRFDTQLTQAYFAAAGQPYRPRLINEAYVRGILRLKTIGSAGPAASHLRDAASAPAARPAAKASLQTTTF